jgi:uncharacterized protein (DUF305 family)
MTRIHLSSFAMGTALATATVVLTGFAQPVMPDHATMAHEPPPALLSVSNAYSFTDLMANADAVMHHAMAAAPRDGDPDHDFASAMIPHHQGAVDMAKIELLYGRDPALRRLAQEIIVSQQQEIDVMRRRIETLQVARHSTPQQPKSKATP